MKTTLAALNSADDSVDWTIVRDERAGQWFLKPVLAACASVALLVKSHPDDLDPDSGLLVGTLACLTSAYDRAWVDDGEVEVACYDAPSDSTVTEPDDLAFVRAALAGVTCGDYVEAALVAGKLLATHPQLRLSEPSKFDMKTFYASLSPLDKHCIRSSLHGYQSLRLDNDEVIDGIVRVLSATRRPCQPLLHAEYSESPSFEEYSRMHRDPAVASRMPVSVRRLGRSVVVLYESDADADEVEEAAAGTHAGSDSAPESTDRSVPGVSATVVHQYDVGDEDIVVPEWALDATCAPPQELVYSLLDPGEDWPVPMLQVGSDLGKPTSAPTGTGSDGSDVRVAAALVSTESTRSGTRTNAVRCEHFLLHLGRQCKSKTTAGSLCWRHRSLKEKPLSLRSFKSDTDLPVK